MHRQPLLNLLQSYTPVDADEQGMTAATIAFVEEYPNCFDRSLRIGHITGSAWIVSPDRQQVLLIHHRKLDRWLQPGGHADGDSDVAAVALREAQEETGLTSLQLVEDATGNVPVFDVDIHTIPARGDIPEHLHYDIRFLVEANPEEAFGFSDEIKNIRWFSAKEAISYADSESISRMARKKVKN
ncbi:NUDIX hydrolase [Spirosoma utsteinense]|uniref:8-oxo-dGTP pyrophosphatase MutT (NUDIX family) n=1 Tax=Spirosoma utsteinense TaxID=2585773 RepID=A0ABR6WC25_9BACT|nr:NUDIX hydrolase [Spirosoma utsteinense]MBC3786955.1 8-oxo-dGTP pyrophosphatase MutT (NUDIX family) [Spirosoma utsteinense]MBC3794063.1 8-oxo-dGTP pyrophosphatase MutT (NUDIX family) [Spirosoma utsteinense]